MNTAVKSIGLAVLLTMAFSTQAWSQLPFVQPMGGTNNVDWTIVNYVDLDSTAGRSDYTGAVNSSAFTYNGHNAIDMTLPNFAAMDRGVPVFAARAGTVSFVEDRRYDRCTSNCDIPGIETANWIGITHTDGFETLYYHLARNSALVNVGDTVTAGQQIALVGSSGNSSDAHLHFQVESNGTAFETYLNPSFYWFNPLPYAGDGARIIDSGFTTWNQTLSGQQLRDRPSDNDVVFQSQPLAIHLWAQVHSLDSADVVTYRLVDPNNNVVQTINQTPGIINWGWLEQDLELGATPTLGLWRVDMLINSALVRSDQFNYIAAPQTRTWVNNAINSVSYWSTAANWSGNAVPGAGEDVLIIPSDGINRTITYNQTGGPTLKSLWLDLTGDDANRVYFFNDANDMSLIDSLVVGYAGRATFFQTGGRITTANPSLDVIVGYSGFSDGQYHMSNDSALHVARHLVIGHDFFAFGTFNQTGGTTTTVGSTNIGFQFGSFGTYNLSGGTLDVGSVLYVGNAGQGDLNVSGRSQVISDGATLGYGPLSRGTATFDGDRATWDMKPGGFFGTVVGRQGVGMLNIRNGATVNNGNATLGSLSSGTGNVNVDSAGTWNVDALIVVGEHGVGNLNVTNGGRVESGSSILIGHQTNSQGTVVVDGHANGQFSVLRTDLDMRIGYNGSGRVTVSNDATLAAHDLHIGDNVGVGRLTVNSSGDVFVQGTVTVGFLGTLDGDSYVSGQIRNSGIVYPSTSPTDPGALLVTDYKQEAGGALKISLASDSNFSQLSTVPLGSLMLGGTLFVETIGGFSPYQGEVFQILNSNNISGTFSFLQLPALNPGLYWYTNDLYTNGTIRVAGTGIDGDFTSEGYVDNRDYIVWRKGQGSQTQYDQWRANFGTIATGAGSSVSVPEPSSLLLCLLAAALIHFHAGRPMRRVPRALPVISPPGPCS